MKNVLKQETIHSRPTIYFFIQCGKTDLYVLTTMTTQIGIISQTTQTSTIS
jgi:hypothetical protein